MCGTLPSGDGLSRKANGLHSLPWWAQGDQVIIEIKAMAMVMVMMMMVMMVVIMTIKAMMMMMMMMMVIIKTSLSSKHKCHTEWKEGDHQYLVTRNTNRWFT